MTVEPARAGRAEPVVNQGAAMRLCIIGKYPPIQGGVSMRTYWTAHGLARRGHDVHVVTNAKEALPPDRMHMRREDWARCCARYQTGSVTVHWSDPPDRSQAVLPPANPVVSKLTTLAARAHAERGFDVIFSYYLEPYGVAGHLAAVMTGVPHVVRMAGSDAGRLWHHPQLEQLYDHVLRSAAVVMTGRLPAQRAIERGVAPERITADNSVALPYDRFTPQGPKLDIAALLAETRAQPELRDAVWGNYRADHPHIGIYGKLGEAKGSFALLQALRRLMLAGIDVSLVAPAHGSAAVEQRFRDTASELGLADRVVQIPFLPHWRVPEFLRGCLAVCCLEQDFPIAFHTPVTPREVLHCGTCLVASTEVVRKLPRHERLPHGYGCIAVEDTHDIDALSAYLAAIVRNPRMAAAIGARGRAFALSLPRDGFPTRCESIVQAAASRAPIPPAPSLDGAQTHADRFALTWLAATALARGAPGGGHDRPDAPDGAGPSAACVLSALEEAVAGGRDELRPLAAAVRTEIAIAAAEDRLRGAPAMAEPRLRARTWPLATGDFAGLIPLRDPQTHLLEFDYDVADFFAVREMADFPATLTPGPSYVVAFAPVDGRGQAPLLVDALTARILLLSDGTRTALEIATQCGMPAGHARAADPNASAERLGWIEQLFAKGLISLHD